MEGRNAWVCSRPSEPHYILNSRFSTCFNVRGVVIHALNYKWPPFCLSISSGFVNKQIRVPGKTWGRGTVLPCMSHGPCIPGKSILIHQRLVSQRWASRVRGHVQSLRISVTLPLPLYLLTPIDFISLIYFPLSFCFTSFLLVPIIITDVFYLSAFRSIFLKKY